MQRIIFSIILVFLCFGINAQDLGLHFMNNVYQSGYTNPGKLSESRIHIGLPSFTVNYGHNGPTIDDMLIVNDDGTSVLDIDAGLVKLKDNNFLRTEVGVETFNIGLRFNKLQIGVSHAMRTNFIFGYPRELPEMAFNGNVQYIDQTVDVGLGINMTAYGELALHGAYQVSDKLSVGARVKILSGVGNISTSKEQLSIYTDPEYYQLTATTDYVVNSGGEFFDLNIVTTADSTSFDINTAENVSINDFLFSKNSGIGFDFGAEYKVNDKLTLGLSVLDLGSINWSNNTSTFTSNGTYTFEGVNADDVFFGEDSLDFEGVVDTMVQILGFEETSGSYKTSLIPKFYLSGSYQINKSTSAGAVLYGDVIRDKFRPAIGLSIQKRFGKILSLGGVYSIRNNSFDNLGANLALALGPVQIYGVADNVISVFKPLDTKNVNFRFGLNIAVGEKKKKKADNIME